MQKLTSEELCVALDILIIMFVTGVIVLNFILSKFGFMFTYICCLILCFFIYHLFIFVGRIRREHEDN